MSLYKTREIKRKGVVNVGTSNTEIFPEGTEMKGNERIIQNLDSTVLYVSFNDTATLGTNGEIALEQYGVLTTSFYGKINGIRSGAPTDANNTTILTI